MALDFTACESNLFSAKIDEKASDIFHPTNVGIQLELLSLRGSESLSRDKNDLGATPRTITDRSELKRLRKEANEESQIYFVRQKRTWGRLNISRDLFEDLVYTYQIFQPFWKYIFAFGRKSTENEFEFPGFTTRRTSPLGEEHRRSTENLNISESPCHNSYDELAYILRRVELHRRVCIEGQSPWSIRQTAIYHKLKSCAPLSSTSTFIVIAPSPKLEEIIYQSRKQCHVENAELSPWHIHWLLIADSLRGWGDYMAWLEAQLKKQTEPIIFSRVGVENDSQPQLDGFHVSFEDRRNLKQLEDYATDLKIILQTMIQNLAGVESQCREVCTRDCHDRTKCGCQRYLEEFDNSIRENNLYLTRTGTLQERIESTKQLLSNLLDYEEASALKCLAQESSKEGRVVAALTLRSTKDAMAVKILTIISLIYLPTTIVFNFFSTAFVHSTNEDRIGVSEQAWILAAIAIPLTIITIALWWTCVCFARPLQNRCSEPNHRGSTMILPFCSRRRTMHGDVENVISSESTGTEPRMLHHEAAATWSSTVSTLRGK